MTEGTLDEVLSFCRVRSWAKLSRVLLVAVLLPCLGGCRREAWEPRLDPPVAAALRGVAFLPDGILGRPPEVYFALGERYRRNAYQLSEGKRLFTWFGCRECHGEGQGTARGPALLDGWWNYGADIETIYLSLRDGRAGGMPAFGSRLTQDQLWQLTDYVQQLGIYSAEAAAPGHSDEAPTRPAENRAPARFAPLEP